MKGWHVRAAAFVVTAGSFLLATGASAGGTQLLCLNGQRQFVTCAAGTVPVSPSLLLPPTTGSGAGLAHPDTGPVPPAEPSATSPHTRASRSHGPTMSTAESKAGAGSHHLVLIAMSLLLLVAVCGALVLWLSRRRLSHNSAQNQATVISLTDGAVEENEPEPRGACVPTDSRGTHAAALTSSMLSELDTDELMEARHRNAFGDTRSPAAPRIDLFPTSTNPDSVIPSNPGISTPFADNSSDESEIVILFGDSTSEHLGQVEDEVVAGNPAPGDLVEPSPPDSGGATPTLLSIRRLVDGTFGRGTFRSLSQSVLDDVIACLDQDRTLDAAFSAAHYLALGHDPRWSRSNHERMVEAKRAAIEVHHRAGQLRMAATSSAALRLLKAEPIPEDHSLYVSVLRSDLQDRLSQQRRNLRAAGVAADLYLLSGQWMPNEGDSHRLIDAVDSAVRSQSDNDPIIEAARVALWVLASLASRNGPLGGHPDRESRHTPKSTPIRKPPLG
jgi:hypothetical protein